MTDMTADDQKQPTTPASGSETPRPERLTDERLVSLRDEYHPESTLDDDPLPWCDDCDEEWPCTLRRIFDDLLVTRAALSAAEQMTESVSEHWQKRVVEATNYIAELGRERNALRAELADWQDVNDTGIAMFTDLQREFIERGQALAAAEREVKRLTDDDPFLQMQEAATIRAEQALAAERDRHAPLRAQIKAAQDRADRAAAALTTFHRIIGQASAWVLGNRTDRHIADVERLVADCRAHGIDPERVNEFRLSIHERFKIGLLIERMQQQEADLVASRAESATLKVALMDFCEWSESEVSDGKRCWCLTPGGKGRHETGCLEMRALVYPAASPPAALASGEPVLRRRVALRSDEPDDLHEYPPGPEPILIPPAVATVVTEPAPDWQQAPSVNLLTGTLPQQEDANCNMQNMHISSADQIEPAPDEGARGERMRPCPCCGGNVSTIRTQADGTACPCPLEDIQDCGRCVVHCEHDDQPADAPAAGGAGSE